MYINTATGNKTTLYDVVDCSSGKHRFPRPRIPRYPQASLLLDKQPGYKFLPQILLTDIPGVLRWLIPQQSLFSVKSRLTQLKITIDIAFWCFIMLFPFKEHEKLCLSLPMIYLYCELGCHKAIANLRSFFPQFGVKGLCEGQNCLIGNFLVLIYADHVLGAGLHEYAGGEF